MSMVHQLVTAVSHVLTEVTPTPVPTSVSDETVTPGPIGFLATAFVALVTIALIYDAIRRIRRLRYRGEIIEKLEAEAAADHAARESEILDEFRDNTSK